MPEVHEDSKRTSAIINDALYRLKCSYNVKSYPTYAADRAMIQWGKGSAAQMIEVDAKAFGLWLTQKQPRPDQITSMLQRKADLDN